MGDKAVITCALNGVLTDPKQHHVPVTPEEMAREAKAAFNARASIMHIHLRQQEPNKGHLPSWEVSVSREIQQAVREACPGVIINHTTGTSGPNYQGALDCVRETRPEIAACNAGSLNYLKVKSDNSWAWPPMMFDNSVGKVQDYLDVMREAGTIPEFECFDLGIVRCVGMYRQTGMYAGPLEYNFVMGVASGMPADPDLLPILLKLKAPDANWHGMLALIARMRALEERTRTASAAAKDRFHKRGQLLPRERVALVLDPGSPFIELSTLAGYMFDVPDADKSVPGGGVVAGIGFVSGIRCMVSANDSGIDAGALQPYGLDKTLRVQELALENQLPYVQLVESAGANLLRYRVEDFVRGGNIFRNLARLSAAGLPVVTVTHGSSTAGGAYQTGLSDYIVMVRGRTRAFLAGPPLLKAATGEIATEEELGGAEMHTSISGLGDYLAEDDRDALRIARDIMHACCQLRTPLLDPNNTTGYMVGRAYEEGGMIKHGSKMIQAVTSATVPQITIYCGASFGAGNYGMCGRGFHPRFCFSWPNAKTAVMGGEQAAETMAIVTEAAAARRGKPIEKEKLEAMKAQITGVFDGQMDVFSTSARVLDDGVIDPRDTRSVLSEVLAICREAEARTPQRMQFSVARP